MSYLETRFEGDIKKILGKLEEVADLLHLLTRCQKKLPDEDPTELALRASQSVPKRPRWTNQEPPLEIDTFVVENPTETEKETSEEIDGPLEAPSRIELPISSVEELVEFDQQVEQDKAFRASVTELINSNQNSVTIPDVVADFITGDLLVDLEEQQLCLLDFYLFREYLYNTFFSDCCSSCEYLHQLTKTVPYSIIVGSVGKFQSLEPLRSDAELDALDVILANDKKFKQSFVSHFRRLYDGFPKKLSLPDKILKLVSSEVILDYNWVGKYRKKSLSEYSNIFETFRGILKLESAEFQTQMKKAIRLLHNREHIANTRRRKTLKEFVTRSSLKTAIQSKYAIPGPLKRARREV